MNAEYASGPSGLPQAKAIVQDSEFPNQAVSMRFFKALAEEEEGPDNRCKLQIFIPIISLISSFFI